MAITSPGITLLRGNEGYRLEQHRPAVGPVLAKLPLDQALAQVTNLLPICGEAQRIAAGRALDAAPGRGPDSSLSDVNETLFREQLQSSLWRLVVDWPGLVDEAQNLDMLRRALRTRTSAALREPLREALDGLDRVEAPAEVEAWIGRGDCTAARVVARALELESRHEPLDRPGPLSRSALTERKPSVPGPMPPGLAPGFVLEMSQEPGFWPSGEASLVPPSGEVGAWAMGRHDLVGDPGLPGGMLTGRLLAQALDAAFLVHANPGDAVIDSADRFAASAEDGTTPVGVGWAMTARGPLLHHLVLEDAGSPTAQRWDVLAPTDWHFGPDGPVARTLASLEASTEPEFVRFFVAGFDPCAAWSVRDAAGDG